MENLLTSGLVSVTFRGLPPEDIINIAAENELKAIEWGSDVHIQAGNNDIAALAYKKAMNCGIIPISYGTYYGKTDFGIDKFRSFVDTAEAIKTNNLRIWAGQKGSDDVSENERKMYVAEVQTLADIAAEKNMNISFECHGSTLTDKPDSAIRLIEEIARDNVYLYWQPLQSEDIELNKKIIKRFLPYLSNVHVYAWKGLERFPLIQHEKAWREYIDVIGKNNKKHALLLEFVKDDSEKQFAEDAKALNEWMK